MADKATDSSAAEDLQIQHELESAISAAVEKARRDAATHPYLGHPTRRRRDDYYADVAIHHLFLIACGADVATQKGGDVRKASSLLRAGGTIARGWKSDDDNSQSVVLLPDSGFSEDDVKNREELRRSAGGLVRSTIVKALVDHVSKGDPEFRSRVNLAIEARIPKDDSGSKQSEMFSEFVRSSTRNLLGETL